MCAMLRMSLRLTNDFHQSNAFYTHFRIPLDDACGFWGRRRNSPVLAHSVVQREHTLGSGDAR